jgi:hypothetical protein
VNATVIQFRPRLPERICRECELAHAIRCERCARWSCLHYASTARILGKTSTLCVWCAGLTRAERLQVIDVEACEPAEAEEAIQ